MPLTDTAIRNAKPKPTPSKLSDGGGLYLFLSPSGGKWWRFDYRFDKKRKTLALGVYPDVGLKDARIRRDTARKQLADGIDPSNQRKAEKAARAVAGANTFEVVAREWHAQRAKALAQTTLDGIMMRMNKHLFPWLGQRPVVSIVAPELLTVLRRAEANDLGDTPRRLRQYCGQIFRYAIATGRAERDPAADLRGALKPHKPTHHAAIVEPRAVGALLRAIDSYSGEPVTKAALRIAPLVFVRPGELRRAEWSEIDFEAAVWRIPAARMKMRDTHIVPLSRQAIAILRDLQPITSRSCYIFPSIRSARRPMSENTITGALRRLGYSKDEMTGHGFRSIASTLLNEQGWNRDAVERQLAHSERDGVRAAYNRAEHLPERVRMMQEWADYLYGLINGAEVIQLAIRK